MASLLGILPGNSYKQLLQIGSLNTGLSASFQTIQDGSGANSALQISTTGVKILATTVTINGNTLGLTTGNITLAGSGTTFTLPSSITIVGNSHTVTVNGDTALTGTNTGDQTITLTSDVTGTGSGSFATTIAANVVTYAKFQQVAAVSLVGNATGSLANATGIPLGATLAFSAGALQTAAITGDVTASANSYATTVAKINGVTLGTTTATSGNLLIANGSQWGSTAMSGNVTINSSGVTTIGANQVTLGMHSTLTAHSLIGNTGGSTVTPTAVATSTFIQQVVKQAFTAGVSYTPTTGMVYCLVEAVGGGGGGGGGVAAATTSAGGGGGGAGGYARRLFTAAQVGTGATLSIGSGGGGNAGANGTNGGSTTVALAGSGTITLTAGGGTGGLSSGAASATKGILSAGGAGGTTTNADLGVTGAPGENGYGITAIMGTGGAGGSSIWGGGGAGSGVNNGASSGVNGTGFGGGGGGAATCTTASTATGGTGTGGAIIITEFIAI